VVCAGGVVCVGADDVVCVGAEFCDEELFGFAGGLGGVFRLGSVGAAPTAVMDTFCAPWTAVTGANWDEVVWVLPLFVAEPAANAIPNAAATTTTAAMTRPRVPPLWALASWGCAESTRPTSLVAVAPAICSSPIRGLALDDTRAIAIPEERSLTDYAGPSRSRKRDRSQIETEWRLPKVGAICFLRLVEGG
jgi:hypothetical protein